MFWNNSLGGAMTQRTTTSITLPVESFVERPMRPGERWLVRAVWWRQWRLGHRMPAEHGVIVIDGGRS